MLVSVRDDMFVPFSPTYTLQRGARAGFSDADCGTLSMWYSDSDVWADTPADSVTINMATRSLFIVGYFFRPNISNEKSIVSPYSL